MVATMGNYGQGQIWNGTDRRSAAVALDADKAYQRSGAYVFRYGLALIFLWPRQASQTGSCKSAASRPSSPASRWHSFRPCLRARKSALRLRRGLERHRQVERPAAG